jgi:NAD(P)-dependent dehydrogenase (short-subunit alcohol dehydrogenase family)
VNVVVANRTATAGREAASEIAAETGAETLAIRTDITDRGAVENLVDEHVDAFGGVDGRVNNAGIAFHEPAEEKPPRRLVDDSRRH